MNFIFNLILFVSLINCLLAIDISLNGKWKLWKRKFNKKFSTVQEKVR